jgi:hypothetical protein
VYRGLLVPRVHDRDSMFKATVINGRDVAAAQGEETVASRLSQNPRYDVPTEHRYHLI